MNGKPRPSGRGKNSNTFSENSKIRLQADQILRHEEREPISPAISAWGIIE
ncbi:MAG: hypothetical protein RXQ71_00895 [Caldisphaera sp.]